MEQQLLWIDNDGGVDDAQGVHKSDEHQHLGINIMQA
jgi:hypothetical protein